MANYFKDALKQIIDFLELLEKQQNIKYYIVGGVLVNIYSTYRDTRDIDLALDIHSSKIDVNTYINLLQKHDFNPIQDWSSTKINAQETNIIKFMDKSETIFYDNHIIVPGISKYKKIGKLGLPRRIRKKLFEIECWVASKEDFILSKLVYGGWQDYTDALGCWMRFNDVLDTSYMEKSSKELKVQKEYHLLISGIEDPDEFFESLNGD